MFCNEFDVEQVERIMLDLSEYVSSSIVYDRVREYATYDQTGGDVFDIDEVMQVIKHCVGLDDKELTYHDKRTLLLIDDLCELANVRHDWSLRSSKHICRDLRLNILYCLGYVVSVCNVDISETRYKHCF